jgi:hypothetical protein
MWIDMLWNTIRRTLLRAVKAQPEFNAEDILSYRLAKGAIAQAVSRWPLTVKARVCAREVHVEFMVDKVALGQGFLRVLP